MAKTISLPGIGDFIERVVVLGATVESIKNGGLLGQGGAGNLDTDHNYIESGVTSDGQTIKLGQYVPGVDNRHLLLGLGGFLLFAGVGVALAWD